MIASAQPSFLDLSHRTHTRCSNDALQSLSTSAPALCVVRMQIKASVDKIGQNRLRMRELSEDILEDLHALKSFYDANQRDLQNSPQLIHSLDTLQNQLCRVASRCERLCGAQQGGNKFLAGYKLWRDADEIEAEIARLRETVQSCLNRIHFHVSARSEIAIARTEQNVLVLRTDERSHINRVDTLFGENICGSSQTDVASVLRDKPHDVDLQYLRFKLQCIGETLETKELLIADPGSFTFAMDPYVISSPPPGVLTVIGSMVQVWKVIHSLDDNPTTSSVSHCLDPVLRLAHASVTFGFNDTVYRIYKTGARILRNVIRTYDDDNLLLFLTWILRRLYHLSPCGYEGVLLAQEAVDIRLKLLQSSRTTYPHSDRLVWLHRAISHLAYAHNRNEDIDRSLSHFQEALQLIDSINKRNPDRTIISYKLMGDYSSTLTPHRTFSCGCTIAQSTALTLSLYANSLKSLGRYSEAYIAGRDSIAIIQALRARVDDLPSEFDLLDSWMLWLEENLPSWVNVSKILIPPRTSFIKEAHSEGSDLDEGRKSPSSYVEWGIAV